MAVSGKWAALNTLYASFVHYTLTVSVDNALAFGSSIILSLTIALVQKTGICVNIT